MKGLHALQAVCRMHGFHTKLLLLRKTDACSNKITLCGVRKSGLHYLLAISSLHVCFLMLSHEYLVNRSGLALATK
jgi:hypothetical protein